jgi:hypothetical protein
VTEVVDDHRGQGAGHALAGRQQHVHLARIGALRDLVGLRHELVGGLAARGQDRDHVGTGFLCADDAAGRALDALGIGDGGAAELHHDRLGARRRHGAER